MALDERSPINVIHSRGSGAALSIDEQASRMQLTAARSVTKIGHQAYDRRQAAAELAQTVTRR